MTPPDLQRGTKERDAEIRARAEAAWRAETDELYRLDHGEGDDWMIDREDFISGYFAALRDTTPTGEGK